VVAAHGRRELEVVVSRLIRSHRLDLRLDAPLLGLEDWVLHLATLSGTDGRGTGLAKSLSKGVEIGVRFAFLIVGVAAAAKIAG
jgi:hypothetical protein